MWQYLNPTPPNELCHYGVLGMKWGVRRIRKLDSKIKNEKDTGKQDIKEWKEIGKYHNKNVDKDISRSRHIANKNIKKYNSKKKEIQKEIDERVTKKTQSAINNLSTGKALTQSFLLGSYGALVYNSLKAKNVSTGKAITQAVINNWANDITYGKLSKSARW